MRDAVIAAVRVGTKHVVTWTVAWFTAKGIQLPSEALEAVAFGFTGGVLSLIFSWLEKKFPVFSPVLSLGLSKTTPHYDQAA